METIAEKFPELIDTEKYIQFDCEKCGNRNGSTVHKDGEMLIVVCGNCWTKQDYK